MKATLASLALVMLLAGQALAQEPPTPMSGPDQGPPPAMMPPEGGPPAMGSHGERAWWRDPELRQKLQLSDDQSQKIEKIARDHQMRQIDLRAEIKKQDVLLQSLLEADTPDEAQVLAQVDKLSQARAQLEKSRVEMFLAIRHVLTADQVKKLRDLPHRVAMPGPGPEPPEGAPPAPPASPRE